MQRRAAPREHLHDPDAERTVPTGDRDVAARKRCRHGVVLRRAAELFRERALERDDRRRAAPGIEERRQELPIDPREVVAVVGAVGTVIVSYPTSVTLNWHDDPTRSRVLDHFGLPAGAPSSALK
ncbi:MAG: hypothetical protein KIT31_19730 [Deltaproteobacteria bacterium]|nr:hypothetical protein [Deltaproteobacteria bacterium]